MSLENVHKSIRIMGSLVYILHAFLLLCSSRKRVNEVWIPLHLLIHSEYKFICIYLLLCYNLYWPLLQFTKLN